MHSSLYPGHGPALLQRGSGRWKKVGCSQLLPDLQVLSAVTLHVCDLSFARRQAPLCGWVWNGCAAPCPEHGCFASSMCFSCFPICKCCLLSAVTLHVCDCSFARRQARLCGWVWNWLLVWLGLKPLAEFMCDVELETEVVPVAESWHSALQESCDITGVCSWKPQPLCREVRVVS